LTEPIARTFDFKLHHLAKGGRVLFLCDVALCDTETPQVFEWQIDAALRVIDADILPEIRQLQGGAGESGKLLPFGIAVAAEAKHKMTDRVGGVMAVRQNCIERPETCD